MAESIRWQNIAPKDAVGLDLTKRLDISAPVNEAGERCPWPWDPQQLVGAPLGQYRCPYCSAMCVAGVEHPDYSDWVDGEPPGYRDAMAAVESGRHSPNTESEGNPT